MTSIIILHGDVLDCLPEIPAESVQCVITSPPYLWARDYQTATWEGGDPGCDHNFDFSQDPKRNKEQHGANGGSKKKFIENTCGKCGAARVDRQIGLEPTPEDYVWKMVEVGEGIRRILRPDGLWFLNLGDTYASNGIYIGKYRETHPEHEDLHSAHAERYPRQQRGFRGGEYRIKAKDLIGIPWAVAFALRDDGWWLRRDIVWAKGVSLCPTYSGSCMPESIPNRPSSSHEYVFMLAKSGPPTFWTHRDRTGTRTRPRPDYRYLDLQADVEFTDRPEGFDPHLKIQCPDCGGSGRVISPWYGTDAECDLCGGRGKIRRWRRINLWTGHGYFYDGEAVREPDVGGNHPRNHVGAGYGPPGQDTHRGLRTVEGGVGAGRNLRSVWTINPQPTSAAHFAVFPERLVDVLVRMGTSERGCCPACGAPWVRVIEKGDPLEEWRRQCGSNVDGGYNGVSWKQEKLLHGKTGHLHDREREQDAVGKSTYTGLNERWRAKHPPAPQNASDVKRRALASMVEKRTVEWRPTCDCPDHEPVPCVVADPFAGYGTVGKTAEELGRSVILIEINGKYVELIKDRLRLRERLPGYRATIRAVPPIGGNSG